MLYCCRGYSSEGGGAVFTSVVPCNVFGPHDNFDAGAGHVVPALVRRMHDHMRAGNSPLHYSTPT